MAIHTSDTVPTAGISRIVFYAVGMYLSKLSGNAINGKVLTQKKRIERVEYYSIGHYSLAPSDVQEEGQQPVEYMARIANSADIYSFFILLTLNKVLLVEEANHAHQVMLDINFSNMLFVINYVFPP